MNNAVRKMTENLNTLLLLRYSAYILIWQSVFLNTAVLEGYSTGFIAHTGIMDLISITVTVLIEEFLFRWLMVKTVFNYSKTGIVISSLLFASLHLNLRFFIFYFIAGIILSCSYRESRDLRIPVYVHLLNNLTVILLNMIVF